MEAQHPDGRRGASGRRRGPAAARETLEAMLPKGLLGTHFGGQWMLKPEQKEATAFARATGFAAVDGLDAARPELSHLSEDKREEALLRIATLQANRGLAADATRTAGEIWTSGRRVDVLTALAGASLKPKYPPN